MHLHRGTAALIVYWRCGKVKVFFRAHGRLKDIFLGCSTQCIVVCVQAQRNTTSPSKQKWKEELSILDTNAEGHSGSSEVAWPFWAIRKPRQTAVEEDGRKRSDSYIFALLWVCAPQVQPCLDVWALAKLMNVYHWGMELPPSSPTFPVQRTHEAVQSVERKVSISSWSTDMIRTAVWANIKFIRQTFEKRDW